MGGNALKNTNTRRYNSDEYFKLFQVIGAQICDHVVQFGLIKSYRNKDTFGDMDILYVHNGTINMRDVVTSLFNPNEIVVNGDVMSFNVEELQVDLIKVNLEEYDFAMKYFSYNDLGNLIGRVAHKLGLKFGRKGLLYVYRKNDKILGEVTITNDLIKLLVSVDMILITMEISNHLKISSIS